jgi:hypothetical protein
MVFDAACFETWTAQVIADFREALVHGLAMVGILQECLRCLVEKMT